MRRIGFDNKFMRLVQVLLMGSTSKIHIHGLFVEEFRVTRGVRWGCPISPFVFDIPTQPLMLYTDARIADNYIQGINLFETLMISHRLYVGDLWIFIPTSQSCFEVLLKF